MTTPSSRDLELLSAYLDGQLSPSSRTRLEIRIQSDPALAGALEELRQTRAFLRHTPHRRAPRNFTLTPRMAGIRPPVPRLVPVLSWASAAAMLLFIFTLGAGFIGQLSFGMLANSAAVPMAAGGVPQVAAPMAPAATAPPATAALATVSPVLTVPLIRSTTPPAANQTVLPTPTEATSVMAVEQATPPAVVPAAQPPSAMKAMHSPVNLWLLIWPGLAVILAALAALIFWLNKRAFQRKNPRD